jgi:hypothetical protein
VALALGHPRAARHGGARGLRRPARAVGGGVQPRAAGGDVGCLGVREWRKPAGARPDVGRGRGRGSSRRRLRPRPTLEVVHARAASRVRRDPLGAPQTTARADEARRGKDAPPLAPTWPRNARSDRALGRSGRGRDLLVSGASACAARVDEHRHAIRRRGSHHHGAGHRALVRARHLPPRPRPLARDPRLGAPEPSLAVHPGAPLRLARTALARSLRPRAPRPLAPHQVRRGAAPERSSARSRRCADRA